MEKKAYVYRIVVHNGRKEYKRTKCSDCWASTTAPCWKFSVRGAKKIVDTLNKSNRTGYYSYGYELI